MDRNSYSLSGCVGTRFSSRNEVERSVGNHSHEAQAVIYNLLFQFALVDSYSKFSETIADAILDQIMYYLLKLRTPRNSNFLIKNPIKNPK